MNDEVETGMRSQVADEGGRRLVHLTGEFCLPAAASIRNLLSDALRSGQNTAVDLAGATDVDLSGLQLLCSAHRSFRARGLTFSLERRSAEFCRTVQAAGFDARSATCRFAEGASCLWTGSGGE